MEAILEGGLSLFYVRVVSLPGVEGGVLEGAGEAEGDRPGEGAVFENGGEIVSGLLGSLSTREKDDAGEVSGNMGFERFGGFSADFIRGGGVLVVFTSDDHIGLEDAGAEIDTVGVERFKESI